MTLDTRVYLHDPVDYRELFVKCNQLIGSHEGVKFTDETRPDAASMIWNAPGQGLCALLDVRYRPDGPLRSETSHDKWCDPDCDSMLCRPCWLEVSFDTAYGYKGPDGGCGDLHARLVAELGQWLDGKGVRWQWVNEFTGDVHDGYEGLTELGEGGAEASTWFRDIVAPKLGLTS